MARLSRTILAGTQQMKDAAFGLRDVKARKSQRKKAALQAAGEAFADAGATFKAHGDWKRAKADEDGTRMVDDAYSLGLTTNGGQGALTALGSLQVRTPGAARHRAALTTKAQEMVRRGTVDEMNQAHAEVARQTADKIAMEIKDANTLRGKRKAVLDKIDLEGASPMLLAAAELYATGSPNMDEDRLATAIERDRKLRIEEGREGRLQKQHEDDLAFGHFKVGATEDRYDKNRVSREEMHAEKMELKRRIFDVNQTNEANSAALNAQRQAWKETMDAAEFRLRTSREEREAMAAKLRTQIALSKEVLIEQITGADGPGKSRASGDLRALISDLEHYIKTLPKPPAPRVGAERGGGAPAHPSGASAADAAELESLGWTYDGTGWVEPE